MMDIRKSQERGHANHGWLDSHFTFSFADYVDPQHVQFRTLMIAGRLPETGPARPPGLAIK